MELDNYSAADKITYIQLDMQFRELAEALFVETGGNRDAFKDKIEPIKQELLQDVSGDQIRKALALNFDNSTSALFGMQNEANKAAFNNEMADYTMGSIRDLFQTIQKDEVRIDLSSEMEHAAGSLVVMAQAANEMGIINAADMQYYSDAAKYAMERNTYFQDYVEAFEKGDEVEIPKFKTQAEHNAFHYDFGDWLDQEFGEPDLTEEQGREQDEAYVALLADYMIGAVDDDAVLESNNAFRERHKLQLLRQVQNIRQGNNSLSHAVIADMLKGNGVNLRGIAIAADRIYPTDAKIYAKLAVAPDLAQNGVFIEYTKKINDAFGSKLDYKPIMRFFDSALDLYRTQWADLTPAEQREVLHMRYKDAMDYGTFRVDSIERKLSEFEQDAVNIVIGGRKAKAYAD